MKQSIVTAAYIVPGQPHILLAHDRSFHWQSLFDSYSKVRKEIETLDADIILYCSTQWLSVIGWLFQADPEPQWIHVDPNWHEYTTFGLACFSGSKGYARNYVPIGNGIYARELGIF